MGLPKGKHCCCHTPIHTVSVSNTVVLDISCSIMYCTCLEFWRRRYTLYIMLFFHDLWHVSRVLKEALRTTRSTANAHFVSRRLSSRGKLVGKPVLTCIQPHWCSFWRLLLWLVLKTNPSIFSIYFSTTLFPYAVRALLRSMIVILR